MGTLIRFGLAAVAFQVLAGMLFVVIMMAPLVGAFQPSGQGNMIIEKGKGADSIVAAAKALSQHISGYRANLYDSNEPFMRPVYTYWESICPGESGDVCWYAHTGSLQCVYFVAGAYFLAGYPLPDIYDAVNFWPNYQNRSGWHEIPSTEYPVSQRGLPAPGDLMVWEGGDFGHIAVVLTVIPPHDGRDGSVTVAQGNAPGNRWPTSHTADPANWYTMPLHPDLSIGTWTQPYLFTVRGFIRHV